MSDDLISRKALMEKAKDYFISPDGALRLIESQPTAYDVDKIIKKLEDKAIEELGIDRGRFAMDKEEYSSYSVLCLSDVIEIVKSGGVAND